MLITVTNQLPQTYQAAVEAAVALVGAMFSDSVTVPITFELGAAPGDISSSVAYGNWMAWNGQPRVFVTDAQQVALGLGKPTDPAFGIVQIDGNVAWGGSGYDLNGALIHEITEALGRLSTDDPASPTVLDLNKPAGLSFASAPLDPGDFAGTTPDAFDGQFTPGVTEPLTWADAEVMVAIGFKLSDRVSVAVGSNGPGTVEIDNLTIGTGQIGFASIVPGIDPHELVATGPGVVLAAGFSNGPIGFTLVGGGEVIAGEGDATIWLGTGSEVVWDGMGHDVVVADAARLGGLAQVEFLNFNPARDVIRLVGFGAWGAESALGAEVAAQGGGTEVRTPNGDVLVFDTVKLGALGVENFIPG